MHKNVSCGKKLWRAKLKENPQEYERYKIDERYRKLKKSNKTNNTTDTAANIVIENASKIVEERPSSSNGQSNSPPSSFSNKQSLHRSLSRVNNYLPKSPHKKAEVIERCQLKFQLKKSTRGRPHKDLNDDE